MNFSFGPILFNIVLILCGMLGFYLNWFSFYTLVTVIFCVFGFMSLVLVLKLPWDLYFEAKDVIYNQQQSIKKDIFVSKEDLDYALKAKSRLLLLCLVVHAICAGVAALISYQSQSQIGYYFSGVFTLSTIFRPLLSYFQKERQRLIHLKSQCLIPRDDSQQIQIKLADLEDKLAHFQNTYQEESIQMNQKQNDFQEAIDLLQKQLKSLQLTNKDQYDKVLNEFTKSIEKLTEDQELLRGFRAIVKLLKEDPR
ncbi:MAG: hypothetical protein KC646_10485 [Candidatus Cloacimonetes bacterium]|nr:hypothetical protein [Candidatus Cloacimonadota bacterium]